MSFQHQTSTLLSYTADQRICDRGTVTPSGRSRHVLYSRQWRSTTDSPGIYLSPSYYPATTQKCRALVQSAAGCRPIAAIAATAGSRPSASSVRLPPPLKGSLRNFGYYSDFEIQEKVAIRAMVFNSYLAHFSEGEERNSSHFLMQRWGTEQYQSLRRHRNVHRRSRIFFYKFHIRCMLRFGTGVLQWL